MATTKTYELVLTMTDGARLDTAALRDLLLDALPETLDIHVRQTWPRTPADEAFHRDIIDPPYRRRSDGTLERLR